MGNVCFGFWHFITMPNPSTYLNPNTHNLIFGDFITSLLGHWALHGVLVHCLGVPQPPLSSHKIWSQSVHWFAHNCLNCATATQHVGHDGTATQMSNFHTSTSMRLLFTRKSHVFESVTLWVTSYICYFRKLSFSKVCLFVCVLRCWFVCWFVGLFIELLPDDWTDLFQILYIGR